MKTKLIYQSGQEKAFDTAADVADQLSCLSSIVLSGDEPEVADQILTFLDSSAVWVPRSPIVIRIDVGDSLVAAFFARKAKKVQEKISLTYLSFKIIKDGNETLKKLDGIMATMKPGLKNA